MTPMKLEGGCLCGRIRYVIEAAPVDAGFCHCRTCQRASGAPVVAWLTVPSSGFAYRRGGVGIHDPGETWQREFCPACGTQLVMRSRTHTTTLDVTLCSLDDSSRVVPQYHIWFRSKVAWLHVNDELPRYDDAGPDA